MKNHLIQLSVLAVALSVARVTLASTVLSSVVVGPQSPSSINPGSNATYNVTVARTGTGNLDIYLSCSGLPTGATAAFSPGMVHFSGSTPTGSASLAISTTTAIAAGVYTFTTTARDGGSPNIVTNTGTLTIGIDGKTTLSTQSITSLQVLPNGTASIALHGAAVKSYVLQATTTLSPSAWVNIATNTTDASGDCLLVDASASNYSSR